MSYDTPVHSIRIGTCVPGGPQTPDYIRQIVGHGFESFQIMFGAFENTAEVAAIAVPVMDALAGTGAVISSLFYWGNILGDQPDDAKARKTMEILIDTAHLFGTDLLCGFAGRVRGVPLPDSMPRYKEVVGAMAKRASDKGVRIAYENCPMGGDWHSGDWNIAHNPAAWEMMYDAVPAANIGLCWEPCHQMCQLIDPVAQLRKWAPKVFHLHGKDATIAWDVIRESGVGGVRQFAWHRTPGFGDTNWSDIITIMRMNNFKGSIDIEGWHDPVYIRELEMTGQVHGLNYLKRCRGGDFIANPV